MGVVVVSVCPSPKSHAYVAMVPMGDVEADASNVTADPEAVAVNRAVGAGSGVMATPARADCGAELNWRVDEEPVVVSMKATS